MKTVHFFIFILMLVFSSNFTHLSAQQDKISIQSTLKDISGKAIPDGDVNVTFRLYHEMEQGQAEWTESAVVSVVGGIYSHKLGSITPLPPSIFGLPLYLGVTVAGGQELIPRTELTASPFAISVRSLAGGGQSAAFEPNGKFNVSGNAQVNGNLHIQKPSSNTSWDFTIGASNHGILRESNRLNIADNGTGRLLLFDNGSNQIHSSESNGTEVFVNGVQRFRTDIFGSVTTGRHAVFGNLDMHAGGNINTQGGHVYLGETGHIDASWSNNPNNVERWVRVGDNDTGMRSAPVAGAPADGIIQVMSNGWPSITARNTKIGINKDNPVVGFHVGPFAITDGYSDNYTGFSHFSGSNLTSHNGNTQHIGTGENTNDIVAYFEGGVVSNLSFYAAVNNNFSDIRTKNILNRSNSKNDLSLLNKVKITDYQMIDRVKDNKEYKKVIAQELKEIFPQSVSTIRNVIPNIFCTAKNVKFYSKKLTITLDKPHQLLVNDHIELLSQEAKLTEVKVLNVLDTYTFEIESDKNLTNVFVYGKYVDDFLTVDYDALSMLNISATQELYKRLVELETENKALKTTTAKLEDRMERIEAMLTSNTADVIETKTLAKK